MARTGTSVYPATLDAFDRIGTANYEDESGYDHVNVHNEVMDGIEHLEAVMGTTAGTSVLKNVLVGQFVATTAGTETLTNKTINSATIGTPTITGGTASNFNMGSPTFNSGTALTATSTELNSVGKGALNWGSYVPVNINITTGNGSNVGKYCIIGKTVFFWTQFSFGTSSAFTGAIQVGLPVPVAASGGGNCNIHGYDAAAGYFHGVGFIGGGGTTVSVITGSGTAVGPEWDATHPITWTTSDSLLLSGFYEVS